ncbi:MAG: hypothetical protein A2Y33_05235 [Spirochaetes bacterium GWF1_51_8]|nr:MAG: hypothetical protein A2Y33_05235 [Spirochaetes bacterium GWF1_51_8]
MKEELTQTLEAEKPKLLGYIRKRLNRLVSDTEPEDILQEVSLNLFNRLDLLKPVTNVAGYIYAALLNHITDLHRKKSSKTAVTEYDEDEDYGDLGNGRFDVHLEFQRREVREALFEALAQLPEEQREIWIATELDGREYHEIAEEKGIPLGTLLARKNRANKKLRKMLKNFYE